MVKGFFITKGTMEYDFFIRAFGFNPQEWPLLTKEEQIRGYHPYPLIWTLGNWSDNRSNYDLIEQCDNLGATIVDPATVRRELKLDLPTNEDVAKVLTDLSEKNLSSDT